MISRLKKILKPLESRIVEVCASTRFLSALYWLARGGFSREQQAVLAGKVAYKKSLADPGINTSLLRRNTHRLEKGMLMRPRRVPFALNYIAETVNAYALAVRMGADGAELAWAGDVLEEYMNITPAHPKVDSLREVVRAARSQMAEQQNGSYKRVPYKRDPAAAPRIDFEEFLKLVKYRRSVRWYLQKPVPREMVMRAVEAAAYSPTACNRQPYEFRIIDDPALVSEVIQYPGGTAGFSQQVPAVAIVVGKLRNYFGQHDRHLVYTDASLAIMSFVYALEVQGLGSCCINWPDIEEREKKMEKFLKLAPDERPIMLVSYGWPDPEGLVANSTKKTTDVLCKFNFE